AELEAILGDEARLRGVVSDEMADVAATFGTPRRTILLESAGGPGLVGAAASPAARGSAPLEIADTACWVLLSATGLLARTGDDRQPEPVTADDRRAKHDVVRAPVATTARGWV